MGLSPLSQGVLVLRGYHHGYRHGYDHGYRDGTRAGFRAGRRSVARPVQFNNINVYKNRKAGVVMSGNMCRNQVDKATVATVRPSAKPNDLYTDKQGNIYQRGQNGNWIEKSNRPTIQPSRQPEQLPPMNKPIDMSNIQRREIPQQQLTRSHQSRARGEMRVNRSRAAGAARARAVGDGDKRNKRTP